MIDFVLLSYARSGSSALRHQLNLHADIVVPPEASFAVWLMNDTHWVNSLSRTDSDRFISHIASAVASSRKFEHWGLSRAQVESILRLDKPQSVRDAFASIYRAYALGVKPESRIIGDKNNWLIADVPSALSALRPQKVVLLWRNPIDVWRSFVALRAIPKPEPGSDAARYFPCIPSSSKAFAKNWTCQHSAALEDLDRQDCDLLVISQSSMTIDWKTQRANLCNFLGVKVEGFQESVNSQLLEPNAFALWTKSVRQSPQGFSGASEQIRLLDHEALEIEAETLEVREQLLARATR